MEKSVPMVTYMPEPTTQKNNRNQPAVSTEPNSTEHTCACGEVHEHHEEGISHRDECTSTQKFTDSCCCGSGDAGKEARNRCGHGPRCH
ncbi:MAG: hypothetical protein Q8S57_10335 [Methanoregula sp.]|nr:hypothetical protein [Methanoregula sp.]